jgi:monoamine oxidase
MSGHSSNYQVIVIGGGMAGISACVKLVESGVQNILLIEGSQRLGGRINTIPFRNCCVFIF